MHWIAGFGVSVRSLHRHLVSRRRLEERHGACWRQLIRKRKRLSLNFRIVRFRTACFMFESNRITADSIRFGSDSNRAHIAIWEQRVLGWGCAEPGQAAPATAIAGLIAHSHMDALQLNRPLALADARRPDPPTPACPALRRPPPRPAAGPGRARGRAHTRRSTCRSTAPRIPLDG